MDIQIYDQVSILRSWSKAKLHRAAFLGFGFKGVKNNSEHHESWCARLSSKCTSKSGSNFNSKKLVKNETLSCDFTKFWLKRGENSSWHHEFGVHACLSNGHPNLWSNFKSEKLIRSETSSCFIARVGLKGVQIAQNIAKVDMHISYQTGIQIYDQISTPRIWSKVKLHHSISITFGLKERKIALNIMKFFMHSYLTRNLTKICVHAKVSLKREWK